MTQSAMCGARAGFDRHTPEFASDRRKVFEQLDADSPFKNQTRYG
jgi:hypothetical protein